MSNWINSSPYKQGVPDKYYELGKETNGTQGRRANAAFAILARNSDLPGILDSIKQVEDRFNKKFHYPYVFLNEEEFSEDFKKYVHATTPISKNIVSWWHVSSEKMDVRSHLVVLCVWKDPS